MCGVRYREREEEEDAEEEQSRRRGIRCSFWLGSARIRIAGGEEI